MHEFECARVDKQVSRYFINVTTQGNLDPIAGDEETDQGPHSRAMYSTGRTNRDRRTPGPENPNLMD
jgi:hypothetical protein